MYTIHMIGNAHLDPVWLWRVSEGMDAVLATARSACDRLDEYPEFVFTCSTLWFHRVVEELDPELFTRICRHVESGRWQPVGGMVVQPDCNLPSALSFARQLEFGQSYYRERFGLETTVGYNVDSFGHTAYLPAFLRRAGLGSYVFMRPGPHEKELPAHVFRWRSPTGEEVIAFRIVGPYCTSAASLDLSDTIRRVIEGLPEGIAHGMCFYGVGDHGGGPTKRQIEWIRDHARAIEGVELRFSHPQAFFAAIAEQTAALPVVEGELQHHAIGCYSVGRPIKQGMQAAEQALQRTESVFAAFPEHVRAGDRAVLERAWLRLLFNQFHDILGATCLVRANERAAAELETAAAEAADACTRVTRRASRKEARPGIHKICVFHPGDEAYSGLIRHSPWIQFRNGSKLELFDDNGLVPVQRLKAEAPVNLCTLVWQDSVPARGLKTYTLKETPDEGMASGFQNSVFERLPRTKISLTLPAGEGIRVEAARILAGDIALVLRVFDDPTDTWSHSAGHTFGTDVLGEIAWDEEAVVVDRGELVHSYAISGSFGDSRATCELIRQAGEDLLRLRLRVTWAQIRQRLALVIAPREAISGRVDLVSGGPLPRALDGREYPFAGMSCLKTAAGGLTLLAPGVTSCSVTAGAAVLTLLRSPYAAHHDPAPAAGIPRPVLDQGTHEFTFGICRGIPDPAAMARGRNRFCGDPMTWDVSG